MCLNVRSCVWWSIFITLLLLFPSWLCCNMGNIEMKKYSSQGATIYTTICAEKQKCCNKMGLNVVDIVLGFSPGLENPGKGHREWVMQKFSDNYIVRWGERLRNSLSPIFRDFESCQNVNAWTQHVYSDSKRSHALIFPFVHSNQPTTRTTKKKKSQGHEAIVIKKFVNDRKQKMHAIVQWSMHCLCSTTMLYVITIIKSSSS